MSFQYINFLSNNATFRLLFAFCPPCRFLHALFLSYTVFLVRLHFTCCSSPRRPLASVMRFLLIRAPLGAVFFCFPGIAPTFSPQSLLSLFGLPLFARSTCIFLLNRYPLFLCTLPPIFNLPLSTSLDPPVWTWALRSLWMDFVASLLLLRTHPLFSRTSVSNFAFAHDHVLSSFPLFVWLYSHLPVRLLSPGPLIVPPRGHSSFFPSISSTWCISPHPQRILPLSDVQAVSLPPLTYNFF